MNKIDHSNYAEKAFRKYEKAIATVIQNYPELVVFQPRTMKAGTFYSRIRSAMRGFLTHEYSSDIVSKEQLRKLFPQIKSAIRDDKVIFGSHENIKAETKQTSPIVDVLQAKVLAATKSVDEPTAEVIKAFALLISRQYIESVDFTGVDIETVSEIVQPYGIEALPKDGRIYLL